MVDYYMPIYDGTNIVSCDMLRIEFEVRADNLIHFQNDMQEKLDKFYDLSDYFSSLKDFQYRHLFRFGIKGCSFVIGFSLNGLDSESMRKGFIEFNPNKVLTTITLDDGVLDSHGFLKLRKSDSCPFCCVDDCTDNYVDTRDLVRECFIEVFNLIINNYAIHARIKRFDLAIDVAISRDNVQLFKDKRKYTQYMNSKYDLTEYLGSGSTGGRVKVYNKTLESMLDYDLTRVEITSDVLEYFDFMKYFPRVRIAGKAYSSATTILLEMLELIPLDERNRIYCKLSANTKKKYREMLEGQYLDLSCNVFDKIVTNMQEFLKFGVLRY